MNIIQPDLTIATHFLNTLEPQGKFLFQTFDDNQSRASKSLVSMLHGTLHRHAKTLTNLIQKCARIFVTVNQTNLNGRKATDIEKIRAVFVDLAGSH